MAVYFTAVDDKDDMRMLKFSSRYYRTIPIDRMCYETEEIELDPARTALVVLHCWDIGCEGGPPADPNFWVGMGSLESLGEAERILHACIRPAMDAARQAQIRVCHVEHPDIARQYPQSQDGLEPTPGTMGGSYSPPPVVPGWNEAMTARAHGRNYATEPPYAGMGRAQIVEPRDDEPMVYETPQFDRILRRYGIENLIYTGFAADMCILRAPGGLEVMQPYGYRRYLLRDATLGVELPDTFEERLATRWAIRYFETHGGNTLLTEDFIRACEALS